MSPDAISLLPGYGAFAALLTQGGAVIAWLALTSVILWTLILERYWFIHRQFPAEAAAELSGWQCRRDRASWRAQAIRSEIISRARVGLSRGLPLINALVVICPLLGLLGTVTGMIVVFDVIALTRSSDPQAMAQGISRATIPTAVGLVVALSALYFNTRLRELSDRAVTHLSDQLVLQRETTR